MDTGKFFREKVPDRYIRRYIGGDAVGKSCFDIASNYYELYCNALNLTFIYAYSTYRKAKDNGDIGGSYSEYNANFKRVIDIFDDIYVKYSVSFELMQYVLLDIFYDYLRGQDSEFADIMPDIFRTGNKNFKLFKYLQFIKNWQNSARYSELTLDDASAYFVDMIDNLPFLSKYKLVYSNSFEDFVFRPINNEDESDDDILLNHMIITMGEDPAVKFFYLETVTVKNNRLDLSYQNPSQNKRCILPVGDLKEGEEGVRSSAKSYYNEITGNDLAFRENEQRTAEICNVYLVKYKYFKNLALAISDCIGIEEFSKSKKDLFNAFGAKYPAAFVKIDPALNKFDEDNYNWDNVILMLLIETSPTQVLKQLISDNQNICYKIISNLNLRFNSLLPEIGNLSKKELKAKADSLIYPKHNGMFNYVNISGEIETVREHMLTNAMVEVIMSSLVSLIGKSNDRKYVFSSDIQTNIAALRNVSDAMSSTEQNKIISITLGETIRRLICFYEGMFAYGEEKQKYEMVAGTKILQEDEIYKHQQRAEQSFIAQAAKVSKEFAVKHDDENYNMGELFSKFLETCKKCYSSDKSIMEIYKNGKYIHLLLGRHEIANVSGVEYLFNKFLDAESRNVISECIDAAIEILEFFRTGEISRQSTGNDELSLKAIYPYLASYDNSKTNNDGCSVADFNIGLDTNMNGIVDKNKEIKVLTEFSYDMNEYYYCLPNIYRSNRNWWVDPFIIDCSTFNDIFDKHKAGD